MMGPAPQLHIIKLLNVLLEQIELENACQTVESLKTYLQTTRSLRLLCAKADQNRELIHPMVSFKERSACIDDMLLVVTCCAACNANHL